MYARRLSVLLCLIAARGAAQDRPRIPPVLTLRQAIEMALRTSPGLEVAQARASQADARVRAARSLWLPRASLDTQQSDQTENLRAYGLNTPLLNLNSSPFSTFDARLNVSYSIWDPVRRMRQEALQFEADAGHQDQTEARNSLIAAVANAFLAIRYSQEMARALDRQAGIASGFLKIAQDRYEKGAGNALDPNRADQEVRRVRLLEFDAAANMQRSKTALARLLNAQIGTPFEVSEEEATGAAQPSLEDAIRLALASRAEYRAALAKVDAARAAAAAIRAKRLPSAQLHVDSGFDGTSPARGIVTYRVFGALQIPLFHGEQSLEEIEAEARLREARAAAEESRAAVEAEVSIALTDLAAASKKAATAEEIRSLAQQELELATRRLDAGITDNTEQLAAQDHLLRAEEDAARIRFEIRSHRVELFVKMGQSEGIYRL